MEMLLLFGVLAALLGVLIVWDAKRIRRSGRSTDADRPGPPAPSSDGDANPDS